MASLTLRILNTEVAFDAYNIEDNNYFKLRDIAFALNDTMARFSVDWNEMENAISIVGSEPYIPVGGEMGKGDGSAKTATPTDSKIILNGERISPAAYNIGGNNYFKLRDLGMIGFMVDWDEENNTIMISTGEAALGEHDNSNGVSDLVLSGDFLMYAGTYTYRYEEYNGFRYPEADDTAILDKDGSWNGVPLLKIEKENDGSYYITYEEWSEVSGAGYHIFPIEINGHFLNEDISRIRILPVSIGGVGVAPHYKD